MQIILLVSISLVKGQCMYKFSGLGVHNNNYVS